MKINWKGALISVFFLSLLSCSSSNEGSDNTTVLKSIPGAVMCKAEDRKAEACIQIYKPVCGWTTSPKKCTSQECRESYANSCFACKDRKIQMYTDGSCPNA